ncbi:MAG: AAA family ATPase [Solobacterium sp.]|nr:AAA family ATPase [Solobacterium sp.]
MKYHEISHGESFMKLLSNTVNECGLYFLDEPEAALSPQRQLSLLSLMHESIQKGSQFFIVSHSPIVLAYPEADILSFDGQLEHITYEETESYRIMKMFLEHKDRVLHNLFED